MIPLALKLGGGVFHEMIDIYDKDVKLIETGGF